MQNTVWLGQLCLKNYDYKFIDGKESENSSFVEVFRDNSKQKRIVVKKTSLCWLLRKEHVRLSSDRFERVKADIKIKKRKMVYSLGMGKYKHEKQYRLSKQKKGRLNPIKLK